MAKRLVREHVQRKGFGRRATEGFDNAQAVIDFLADNEHFERDLSEKKIFDSKGYQLMRRHLRLVDLKEAAGFDLYKSEFFLRHFSCLDYKIENNRVKRGGAYARKMPCVCLVSGRNKRHLFFF